MIPIKNYKVCITNVDFMRMRIFSQFKMGIGVSFYPLYRGKIGNLGVFVESISEQFLLGSKTDNLIGLARGDI